MPKSQHREVLYLASERFVEAALRKDDSLFTPGQPVWSMEHLKDLSARFLGQPDTGDRAFEEKLTDQLSGAPAPVTQLSAEIIFVYLLIVHHSEMGALPHVRTKGCKICWPFNTGIRHNGSTVPIDVYARRPPAAPRQTDRGAAGRLTENTSP